MTVRASSGASRSNIGVATVAGRPVSRARLEQGVAAIRRGPAARHLPPETGAESMTLRRWLVQGLVAWDVLAHEARASGLLAGEGPEPLTRSVLERLFEQVTSDVTVTDATRRDYYRRNADRFARPEIRHVLHVISANERAAGDVASRLGGARGGIPAGSAMWTLRRGEFTGPLEDHVFPASVGDVVGPVVSELGWHVCRLERVTAAGSTPYEEVEHAIGRELLDAARARAFGEWLERRARALVVIEPAYEHPGHPVHGLPRHRH